jgi:hypothetical protein
VRTHPETGHIDASEESHAKAAYGMHGHRIPVGDKMGMAGRSSEMEMGWQDMDMGLNKGLLVGQQARQVLKGAIDWQLWVPPHWGQLSLRVLYVLVLLICRHRIFGKLKDNQCVYLWNENSMAVFIRYLKSF